MGIRRFIAIVFVGAIALTAISAGVGTSVAASDSEAIDYEYTVTDDGAVETITMRMLVSAETYEQWQIRADSDGYDTVSAWFGEDMTANDAVLNEYTGSERQSGDRYAVTIEFTDVDTSAASGISGSAADGIVTWMLIESDTDDGPSDWDVETYTVVMPDEVTDTNADRVDGETAIWEVHESHPGTFHAQTSPDAGESDDPTPSISAAAAYELTVTEDGSIDGIEMTVTADRETYELWLLTADIWGYDGVGDLFGDIFAADEPAIGDYTAEDEATGDGYGASIHYDDIDLEVSDNMSVTDGDGTVRWETTGVEELDGEGTFEEVTYTVVMPGEITETNAADDSSETATWRIHEDHPGTLTATATLEGGSDDGTESGTGDGTDDTDDTGGTDGTDDGADTEGADEIDTDGDGVPGLEISGALVALAVTVLVLALRRRTD